MNSPCNAVLAIDAGGSFLKAALVRPGPMMVENTFIKIPIASDGSLKDIREAYVRLACSGARKASEMGLVLSGVGVCIPGPFDYAGGICMMRHKYAAIYGIPMRPWFEKGVGPLPIRFLHDSTAFILGATCTGRYTAFRRIGAVIIGTGLGFASMFDSRVFSNPDGGPGISIFQRPYRESTAEEYVSRRAILSHYKKLCPDAATSADVSDIANLARSGQPEAVEVFNALGFHLSEILHDILWENRFECLLLGGAISKSADLFLPALQQGLSDLPTLACIEPAEDIDNAPLLGAAQAALF